MVSLNVILLCLINIEEIQKSTTGNEPAAFKLLTAKNNEDIMTIMEILGTDIDQAMEYYVNSNMDLERWSQSYFN